MRREEAEAKRERLQGDDREHTYFVREQPVGEWEVVRTNIPRPTSPAVVAGRGAASPITDAEQTAELADAARRLKALRERRARLANVPSGEPAAPPEDPRPLIVRHIPGFG
jgi:hypothetical protein